MKDKEMFTQNKEFKVTCALKRTFRLEVGGNLQARIPSEEEKCRKTQVLAWECGVNSPRTISCRPSTRRGGADPLPLRCNVYCCECE